MQTIQKIIIRNSSKSIFEEMEKVMKTDEEWKDILSPEEYKNGKKQNIVSAFEKIEWKTTCQL